MFKRLIIAAGIIAAALSFQTPAKANGGFSLYIGTGHGFHSGHRFGKHFHGSRFYGHDVYGHRFHKPHHIKHFHKKPRYHAKKFRLSNKQIRRHLRKRGLYNIRFVDRHHGVAKVVAHNKRGYIGKYRVSTRNGHILSGRILRHGRRFH